MQIEVTKLDSRAIIPRRMTDGSAGYDLTATTKTYQWLDGTPASYSQVVLGTGLRIKIPGGYVGLLFPRSSIGKTNVRLSNCVGVIDPDYRGEVKLVFDWVEGSKPAHYCEGDRVGQLLIIKNEDIEFIEGDIVSDTERGIGGFGSTGTGDGGKG